MKNEKNFLMVMSFCLLVMLFWGNKTSKQVKEKEPLSKEGLVEIYNQNTLLASIDTINISSFMSDLNLKKGEKINKKRTDLPLYVMKIYNKELKTFNKKENELITINIYDDCLYIESYNVTYKIQSNLSKQLLEKYKIKDLYLPTYRPILGNLQIVELASKQLGNVGGEKFWSWYEIHNNLGIYRRMEWCCVFVSWLGYQTGYLQLGEIPMFPNVSAGVAFYKNRGKWQGKYYVPSPGDVIFFDLLLNDRAYHVGMVEKVVNGRVYTIEGNYNDMVARRSYPVGSPYIYGYGTPNYRVKKPNYLK